MHSTVITSLATVVHGFCSEFVCYLVLSLNEAAAAPRAAKAKKAVSEEAWVQMQKRGDPKILQT